MLKYMGKGDAFMNTQIEIERKYIIEKPSVSDMQAMADYTSSDIVQIYLKSAPAVTRRIRSRSFADKTVYTETVKVRIDAISANESEREISAEQFAELSGEIAQGSRPLRKTRHTFSYGRHTVEIDVYPEWENTAVLEVELRGRDECVLLPDFINIIKEVTGDKRYSNASMSRSFPEELHL